MRLRLPARAAQTRELRQAAGDRHQWRAEHGVALLTTVFGNGCARRRAAARRGPSLTKRAAPGASIDIPLAHKDALYVRSHYDGITITLPTRRADEVAVICAMPAAGGRTIASADWRATSRVSTDLTEEPAMNCKTGAEHISAAGRPHRLYRRQVAGDVTVHPAFRNSVKSAGML